MYIVYYIILVDREEGLDNDGRTELRKTSEC